jgi:hypothetical protein
MRVLLGSGGFRTDERRALLADEMRRHFGSVQRLLFIPYALADHDAYVRLLHDKGLDGDYALDGIHTHGDPVRAVEQAEAVYVGGGNTFRLLHELYRRDLLDFFPEHRRDSNKLKRGTRRPQRRECGQRRFPSVTGPGARPQGLRPGRAPASGQELPEEVSVGADVEDFPTHPCLRRNGKR